jgi:cobalamin synthase
MKRRLAWLLVGALFGAALLAVLAAPALADTSNIGRNVGEEIRSWATALILGVAAVVGIPVLLRRDVNGGLVLALLVIVVGGFVFASAVVRQIIRAIWLAIGQ